MSRLRCISALLAAVLIWAAAAPLLAVTCVPGHECPMAGMGMQAMRAKDGNSVASPDCCLRSERRSESGTVQRTVLPKPDSSPVAVRVALLEPAPLISRHVPAPERHAASEVPLYTLNSILLI
jgi:hypothetical protein